MSRASIRLGVLVVLLLAQPAATHAQALDEASRLAALARVWGLLKYFNPRVAEGQIDWDAVLVRFVPRVKSAGTKEALNHELLMLVRTVDTRVRVPAGAPLEQPETVPALRWLDDGRVLDPVTRFVLKTYRYSPPAASNRYVKPTAANVRNPDFSGEQPWATPPYPSEPYRLLALFRYWNMVQYFFPYREMTDQPWNEVLEASVPAFIAARDAVEYHLAVAELTARINDAHGVLSSTVLTNYWGTNSAPIRIRYIESQSVVTKVLTRFTLGADVRVGDIVTDVNGVPTATRRAQLARYVAASNPASLQRNLSSLIMRTSASTLRIGLSRNGIRHEVVLTCPPGIEVFNEDQATEDKTVSRLLPGNIGYVHMGWLQPQDVATVMTQLKDTRAIIFDSRNYPNGTLGLIAQQLNPDARPFVWFTEPSYASPGTMLWRAEAQRVGPATPSTTYYRGKVIMLADERTQSQAEFTLMAFKTAPDATLVGSQTAGADGNISLVQLPGGLSTYFSGIGVFYPDRRPTQRVGIVPDHYVTPTIAGIRAGVDEVLNYALALVR